MAVDTRPSQGSALSRWRFRLPARAGGWAVVWWPWLLVAAAVIWNLVNLRSLTANVPYLNDSSMHEQMVRFATAQWKAGQLPLTSWFPFLGEGSPQFLHYQSLPAMIAGLAGVVVGPDVAFRWSLYLLLCSWPVSVYVAARLFGARRGAAAASALMAPFLSSVTGVGYEPEAYVWIGYGVWTQLWAMWTLPLAWGLSWRAIRDGRGAFWAVLLIGLTMAFHFETGYLALSVLVVWPLVAWRPLLVRIRRAAVLVVGAVLACAWVVVPLLQQKSFASVNEILQGTGLVDGYGAHQVLVWLFSGQLLDHGRLPVISLLAAVGFGLAWMGWKADLNGRALLIALGVSLLLAFGPATFGSLMDVIPGHQDLFFRRFEMGVQLACLLLAGRGAGWLAGLGVRFLTGHLPGWRTDLTVALVLAAVVAGLAPAWLQFDTYDSHNTAAISAQRSADDSAGVQLDRLIAVIKRAGGGRTYAGMPSNWGADFTVGQVPVFKYLESRDVDEVGYTLRTASLMTDPEYYFDQSEPSDYQLFGIRYLILPAGQSPPVATARFTLSSGPYALWTISGGGYIQAGEIVGHEAANRTNVGLRSIPLLKSDLAADGAYLALDWGSDAAASPLPAVIPQGSAGTVSSPQSDLSDGRASATVHMTRAGVAVLSASYDPGWTATVNGRPEPTRMVAPALVAVDVPAGTDRVSFQYRGYRDYPELFALAALALLTLALVPLGLRRVRRRSGFERDEADLSPT